jgi:hypothetical protein
MDTIELKEDQVPCLSWWSHRLGNLASTKWKWMNDAAMSFAEAAGEARNTD